MAGNPSCQTAGSSSAGKRTRRATAGEPDRPDAADQGTRTWPVFADFTAKTGPGSLVA